MHISTSHYIRKFNKWKILIFPAENWSEYYASGIDVLHFKYRGTSMFFGKFCYHYLRVTEKLFTPQDFKIMYGHFSSSYKKGLLCDKNYVKRKWKNLTSPWRKKLESIPCCKVYRAPLPLYYKMIRSVTN